MSGTEGIQNIILILMAILGSIAFLLICAMAIVITVVVIVIIVVAIKHKKENKKKEENIIDVEVDKEDGKV